MTAPFATKNPAFEGLGFRSILVPNFYLHSTSRQGALTELFLEKEVGSLERLIARWSWICRKFFFVLYNIIGMELLDGSFGQLTEDLTTDEGNRAFLEKSGCNFKENPGPALPEVDPNRVRELFGENATEILGIIIPRFREYLEKEIIEIPGSRKKPDIFDRFFSKTHKKQRQWRENLPNPAREYLKRKNKLSVASLSAVVGFLDFVSDWTEDQPTKEKFAGSYRELQERLTGKEKSKPYKDLPFEERVELAQDIEETILGFFDLISSPQNTS